MPTPKGGRPFTDLDREQLRQLHAQGAGRNEIARIMGRPAGTITAQAAKFDPPLSFDRTATKDATAARQADQAEQRVRILQNHQDLLELDQHHMLDTKRDGKPWKTILRGSEGVERERSLTFIPSVDWQRHMNASASAAAAITKIASLDTDTGVEAVASLLGSLAEGLGIVDGTPAATDS